MATNGDVGEPGPGLIRRSRAAATGASGGTDPVIWGAVVLLAAAVGLGGYQVVSSSKSLPSTAVASPATAVPTPTMTTPTTSAAELQALAELEQIRTKDASAVSPKGQWVAQLAARYVVPASIAATTPPATTTTTAPASTTTPLSTRTTRGTTRIPTITATKTADTSAASQGNTAEGILAEVTAFQAGPAYGTTTRLLLSTDFGDRHTVDGKPEWVTVAVGGFASSSAVARWCERRFPELAAAEVGKVCIPVQLTKPTGPPPATSGTTTTTPPG